MLHSYFLLKVSICDKIAGGASLLYVSYLQSDCQSFSINQLNKTWSE